MSDAGGDAYFYAEQRKTFSKDKKQKSFIAKKSDLCKVFIIDKTLRYKKIFLKIKGVSLV